jgi:hypothetical protein
MHLVHTDPVLAGASSGAPVSCPSDAIAGLEFQTTDRARVHLLLAHVVDVEGNRLEIGRKQAPRPGRCLHVVLFAELLAAGLRAPRPLLVAVDHCPSLAARVRAAFGWRAQILDEDTRSTEGFAGGDDLHAEPGPDWPTRAARRMRGSHADPTTGMRTRG